MNEEPRGEWGFEEDEGGRGRACDLRSLAELREIIPPSRAHEAGMTSGEVPSDEPTADDLSPERLLREERPDGADGLGSESPAETVLREMDELEAGLGRGKDEAELAREEGGDSNQEPDDTVDHGSP